MSAAIPKHIGYIVDGNRRWAKAHGIPTYEGHLAGYNTVMDVALASFDKGVKYVSAYVFSTENWKRSKEEVGHLMNLTLKVLLGDVGNLEKNDVRLRVVGSRDGVSEKILKSIDETEARTARGKHGTLLLCFNYGGHLEIADAVKRIIRSGVDADKVTPDLIAENIYAPDVPPADIIVRTSGEQRLSNFMLWRSAYSEFLFLEKLWPDMTKDDVTAILEEYSRRGRRFGG